MNTDVFSNIGLGLFLVGMGMTLTTLINKKGLSASEIKGFSNNLIRKFKFT